MACLLSLPSSCWKDLASRIETDPMVWTTVVSGAGQEFGNIAEDIMPSTTHLEDMHTRTAHVV
jgi:hypothetical protein